MESSFGAMRVGQREGTGHGSYLESLTSSQEHVLIRTDKVRRSEWSCPHV
jgi:hypothetical protein